MPLPRLLSLVNAQAYRAHFESRYVYGPPVVTHDGIRVRFIPSDFDHAFYCKSHRAAPRKNTFDLERARRVDWIHTLLADSSLEMFRDPRHPNKMRRVVLEPTTPYVIVIELLRKDWSRARFITAFVVDDDWGSLIRIRRMPRWR